MKAAWPWKASPKSFFAKKLEIENSIRRCIGAGDKKNMIDWPKGEKSIMYNGQK